MSEKKVNIAWKKKCHNKDPKLTPESFVSVWQSATDYDDMIEMLEKHARFELLEDLQYYQNILDRREKELENFKSGEPRQDEAQKVLRGEEVWIAMWGYHNYRIRYLFDPPLKEGGRMTVPVELYQRYLEERVEFTTEQVKNYKRYVCDPLAQRAAWCSSYVPTDHALLCRANVFRKKGVTLKKMEGLEEKLKSKVDKWATLKNIAQACAA